MLHWFDWMSVLNRCCGLPQLVLLKLFVIAAIQCPVGHPCHWASFAPPHFIDNESSLPLSLEKGFIGWPTSQRDDACLANGSSPLCPLWQVEKVPLRAGEAGTVYNWITLQGRRLSH